MMLRVRVILRKDDQGLPSFYIKHQTWHITHSVQLTPDTKITRCVQLFVASSTVKHQTSNIAD